MKNLLSKEIKLAASPLSFWFILFGLLTFCPGYPILVGNFFVCLGLYQSFQNAREANDIVYSALLPVKKITAVKSKFIFCLFIEGCAFLLSAAVTLLRMTVLADAPVYLHNAMMNANLVALGFGLVIYGCFQLIFVRGFFRTAYKFGKPFLIFVIIDFVIVGIGETLHHLPGLDIVNSFGFEHLGFQLLCLALGFVLFLLMTVLAEKQAEKSFAQLDL